MRHKGLLGWRYDCKCNYLITLVTEPRTSVFGKICEWGVERTAEGKAVYEAWQRIEAEFPGVRATYNAIMPDHFHGIVYVSVDGAADLGAIVSFFAADVERRIGRRVWCGLWRDSVCLGQGQLKRMINYVLTNAKRRWIKEHNPGLFRKVMGFSHWRLVRANETLARLPTADTWDFRRFARDPGAQDGAHEYWSLETGEEILKPRKANRPECAFGAGERQPAYDSKAGTGPTWTAMGDPFLLDAPFLVSVRISTETPLPRLETLVEKIVAKAVRGAVVVGPWISPGEKRVKAEVIAAGGRVVQLLPEGMGRYFKPAGGDFDLCADGRLLVVSPFAPRAAGEERRHYGKARFEWLNVAARAIGDFAMGVSRAELAAERQAKEGAGA